MFERYEDKCSALFDYQELGGRRKRHAGVYQCTDFEGGYYLVSGMKNHQRAMAYGWVELTA